MSQPEYVLRTESTWANSYGVGEQISDRVVLFRDGCYGLSKEEAVALLASKRKQANQ